MRKGLLAAALIGTTIFGGALGAYGSDGVHKAIDAVYNGFGIRVDGKAVTTNLEPFNADGHVYVSARAVAEALGAKVGWDGQNVVITSRDGFELKSTASGDLYTFPQRGGASILVPTGSKTGTKNNMIFAADLPHGGTVMVGRLDSTGTDLKSSATVVTAVLNAMVPGFTVTSQQDVTVQGVAAVDIVGSATVSGFSLPMQVRVLDDHTNLWGIVGIGAADSIGPVVGSFQVQPAN